MTRLRFQLLLAFISCFAMTNAAVAACTSTVDRTVHICSPAAGASVSSPVSFSAGALDNEHSITSMALYVDSTKKATSSNSTSLTASIALTAGSHSVLVRAWDSSGFYFSTTESITVTTSTTSASVAISANPTTITSGQSSTLTVTAQNASSVVVTNNQNSTSYTLSSTGGSVTVSPSPTTTYTAKATASNGTSATSSVTVTVSSGSSGCASTVDRTVHICSPAAGASVSSPVSFSAGALDNEHPITSMALYVDSTIKATSSNSASLTASISLTAGSHSVVVRAWDSSGFYFSSTESINVTTSSSSASVAISANPNTISSGQTSTLTVSAQNASSVVVTNSQNSTSYTLSSTGGSITVSPSVTTTYTAKATSSNGISATSSATVTVTSANGGIDAVNHVIFMLQENRSFDSYFGMLNPYRQAHGYSVGSDGHTYLVDGIDDKLSTIKNYDDEGTPYSLFHTTSSCLDDMTSAWLESYGDVSRYDFSASRPVAMDGFVHIAENFAKSGSGSGSFTDLTGQRAMAYYADSNASNTGPELNYYYFMASQFALSDRWFSPVSSKTIPNRIATMSGGTTQGYVYDPGKNDNAPQLGAETIFELLNRYGISWKIYYSHTDSDGTPSTTFKYFSFSNNYIYKNSSGAWVVDSTHIAPISQYYTDVQNRTLPAFAYIEANYGSSDEHPGSGQSILTGQQQVANIVNALMYSPSWSDSAFFFGFDEGGGPYDHVPPVPGHTNQNTSASLAGVEGDISAIAVNPDGYLPCVPTTAGVYNDHCDLRTGDPGTHATDAAAAYGFGAQLGFRIPNFIISPFVRKHYVGHAAMDHTAVLHFLEERYNLPALTRRDAAQPSLLDFFDFANKPWLTPPAQSSLPVPPGVGTTCHPATMQ